MSLLSAASLGIKDWLPLQSLYTLPERQSGALAHLISSSVFLSIGIVFHKMRRHRFAMFSGLYFGEAFSIQSCGSDYRVDLVACDTLLPWDKRQLAAFGIDCTADKCRVGFWKCIHFVKTLFDDRFTIFGYQHLFVGW